MLWAYRGLAGAVTLTSYSAVCWALAEDVSTQRSCPSELPDTLRCISRSSSAFAAEALNGTTLLLLDGRPLPARTFQLELVHFELATLSLSMEELFLSAPRLSLLLPFAGHTRRRTMQVMPAMAPTLAKAMTGMTHPGCSSSTVSAAALLGASWEVTMPARDVAFSASAAICSCSPVWLTAVVLSRAIDVSTFTNISAGLQ